MYRDNVDFIRKGQATFDFLMTYGWAIAIVVVIAAMLFTLGVFDAGGLLGTKAAGFSGVAVQGWQLTSGGVLSIRLTDQTGQEINITGMSATIGNETRAFNVSSLSRGFANAETTGAVNSAAFPRQDAGSGYLAKLTINYTNLNSHFAAATQGTLTGKVIPGSNPACAEPAASPAAGTYSSAQSVALSAESGSTTYYTTDGTTPTAGSPVYSGPIGVPLDTTLPIKAFSAKGGYADSSVFSGTYIVTHTLATPAASPPAGSYNASQNVTLSAESGSTIHYTADGSLPTASSPAYSAPINAPAGANTTIRAYSAKGGYADSPVFSGTYIIASPPSPAPNSSVVLQMNFDADIGTVAVDSSIYGNNGTIVNASHVSGISGQALNFTGIGYVSVPSNASLNVGNNMSVEAWVRWDTDPVAWASLGKGWANIVSKGEDNQWRLQHSSNNGLFEFAVSGSAWVQSTTSPQQGAWYHVVGVANSTHISIYVNGNREAILSYNGLVPSSTWDLNIGRRGGGKNDRQFNGTIDSVRLYNRTLAASEIS